MEAFHTPAGQAFVDACVKDVRQTWPVQSKDFRRWLALELYERTGKVPAAAELKRQIELLEAKALQPDTLEREVHLRAACANGHVYLDLADSSWSAIEIGHDGWRIIQNPPVRFRRVPGMRSLALPEKGGSIETLRSLFNVRDDSDFVLIIAWLLDALRNKGQHPLLVLTGGEGTAKSTLVAILRALIDPSCMPVGGLPRTERELMAEASDRYLLAFDNVPTMPQQISDALCRLSTGAGARPVIINSIDDVVTRADLADRCLFVACDSIPDDRRRSQEELWTEFEKAHAQLLGLLLDAMSHGLRMLPATRLSGLPRMADFALWATACEAVFWPKGTFIAAYRSNIAGAVENLIETDTVASAVRSMMVGRATWTGTATKLFVTLGPIFLAGKGNAPVSARDLAVKLRKAMTPLRKIGITVEFSLEGHNRDRVITISIEPEGDDPRPQAFEGTASQLRTTSSSSSSPISSSAPSAPSASSSRAAGREFQGTAEPDLSPQVDDEPTNDQHNAPSEQVKGADPHAAADHADDTNGAEDVGQAGDADGETGTSRSDKSYVLKGHLRAGEREIPVVHRAHRSPPPKNLKAYVNAVRARRLCELIRRTPFPKSATANMKGGDDPTMPIRSHDVSFETMSS